MRKSFWEDSKVFLTMWGFPKCLALTISASHTVHSTIYNVFHAFFNSLVYILPCFMKRNTNTVYEPKEKIVRTCGIRMTSCQFLMLYCLLVFIGSMECMRDNLLYSNLVPIIINTLQEEHSHSLQESFNKHVEYIWNECISNLSENGPQTAEV